MLSAQAICYRVSLVQLVICGSLPSNDDLMPLSPFSPERRRLRMPREPRTLDMEHVELPC